MTDIRILTFSEGRTDFRKHNLTSYALEVQSLLSVASTKQILDCADRMFTAYSVLVEIRGIITCLNSLCSGFMLIEEHDPSLLTNK